MVWNIHEKLMNKLYNDDDGGGIEQLAYFWWKFLKTNSFKGN